MFPPKQKPPDLDDFGRPIQAGKPPDLDDYGNPEIPEQPGFLSQVWNAINEPLTDLPSRIGRKISGAMESIPTIQQTGQGGLRDWLGWADASAKGFFQGATEGAGDLASSLTSPLNIGTTLATSGSNVALRAGLPQIAKGLQSAAKVTALPTIAHGGMEMGGAGLDFFDPNIPLSETATRFGRGAVEVAGGELARRHVPHTEGPILSRIWPEDTTPTPTPSVSDLLPKLRESLDRDAQKRAGTSPQQFAQQVDPNFAGGEGDPMLAGSQPYQRSNMPPPTRMTLRMPADPQSVTVLRNQGYDFVGMDEKGGMLFERKQPTQQPPDIAEFEDEPQFSRIPKEPTFAFMDPHNFPEGPEPFFHLDDGSTVSQRELVRRGIEVPQLPDEMLGIGRQFPGVEVQELGPMGRQPIDLNQALLDMESDMAKPVGRGSTFAQQVLPEDVDFSRRLPPPSIEQPTPMARPEPTAPHLNEFAPDISMTRQPVHGGYSPEFGRQVMGEQAPLFDEPQQARTKSGQVKIGADVKSLGKILGSSLYKGDIRTIATKELLQNSIDAIRDKGPEGKITVKFDRANDTLNVADNGRGMTPDEVATILTDLGSSGKRSEESAIGGFGLAKASFLLGGENVEVITTARDPKRGGQIIQTILRGSPDDLLSGVQPEITIMPDGTPTGTSVKVKAPKGEGYSNSFYDAEKFVTNISEHSEFPGQIELQSQYESKPSPITKYGGGEELGVESAPGGDIRFIASGAADKETTYIRVMMRNKGMYQGEAIKYLDNPMKVPSKIIVDVDAKVPEGHQDYPFTANREEFRGTVGEKVNQWINDNIITPGKMNRGQALKEAYVNMPTVKTPDGLDLKFFDTGSRYTPEEFQAVQNSPILHQIGVELNRALETLQNKFSQQKWADRLEHVGFVFDDNLRGIHIPNPGADKSMILVNPLQLMSSLPPDEAAAGFAHVILHEFAHVDPHLGRGHSEDFTTNLANIYEKFGARETVRTQDEFLRAVTTPDGRYSPEVQELLSGYTESRGRSVVKEDILSRTGVGSRFTGSGQGNIPPGGKSDGGGTPTTVKLGRERASPANVKQIKQQGYEWAGVDDEGNFIFNRIGGKPQLQPVLESEVGNVRPTRAALGPKTDIKKTNPLEEAYNFPRALVASMDFSAPLRQGIGLLHRGEFYKALPSMFKAWATEAGFRQLQDEIASRPLFKKRADAFGKELPSFAEDAGLQLTDLTDLNSREEVLASTWAEKIPGVRRSNRAYTAFLNKLRADTFDSMVREMKVFGPNAETNIPLARAVADFVNTATGRGSLGKLEPAAKALSVGLFAPRLIASRLGMMKRGATALFSPEVYMMSQPSIRREYLKSLFAIAAVGNTVLQLGKMAGGEVSMDPTNTDFGKLKIGNTRIDPWGGFQQYLVAASRLMSSTVTSSTTGKQYDLSNPQGPYDPTHLDIISRFARGKVHPVIGFAISLLAGKKEMSGEKMKFGLDTSSPADFGGSVMENAIAQRFIPLLFQDLYELAQNDELPLPVKAAIGTAGAFGMGQQTYGPKQD